MGTLWLLNTADTSPASREAPVRDAPLSAVGARQTAAAVRVLASRPLAVIYYIPSLAAQYTAELMSKQCPTVKNLYSFFRSEDVGDCGPAACAAHLEAAWTALLAGGLEVEMALVAHPAISRLLLAMTLSLPPERAGAIAQAPAAINRLRLEAHRTVVAGINDLCHLRAPADGGCAGVPESEHSPDRGRDDAMHLPGFASAGNV